MIANKLAKKRGAEGSNRSSQVYPKNTGVWVYRHLSGLRWGCWDWFSVSQEKKCSEVWAGPEGSEQGLGWVCQKSVLVDLAPHESFLTVTSRAPQLPATGANPGCRKEFHPGLTSPSPLLEGRDEGRGGVLCWAVKGRQELCQCHPGWAVWVFRCFYASFHKDASCPIW